MDHPKFLALSDGAWRLWCEGQAYCQKHLTDGVIHASALRRFRYYSAARVRNLAAEFVAGKGPCWHLQPSGDVHVHDFLDWNDSAEEVRQARQNAKERKRKYQEKNASENAFRHASRTANVSSGVVCTGVPRAFEEREGGSGETANRDLSKRAGEFCEWYADTHERLVGVAYIGNPHRDYSAALELCGKLSDQEARDAALVWFGMDDEFAKRGTRTIPKFTSRASDCLLRVRRVTA